MTLASYKVQVGKKVSLAGQIFNGSTHYADPNKVEAVTKFPRPKCLKELTGWMGTCNQLNHCIPWLAGEQPQLRILLRKNKPFIIAEEMDNELRRRRRRSERTSS